METKAILLIYTKIPIKTSCDKTFFLGLNIVVLTENMGSALSALIQVWGPLLCWGLYTFCYDLFYGDSFRLRFQKVT